MSKYDPLWIYLQKQTESRVVLTFDQIHTILGFAIDHSFLTYKKELKSYGYTVSKISLKEKKVECIRI